jgi:hypothetical protein
MSRICLVSYKIRDIHGACTEQVLGIHIFRCCRLYIFRVRKSALAAKRKTRSGSGGPFNLTCLFQSTGVSQTCTLAVPYNPYLFWASYQYLWVLMEQKKPGVDIINEVLEACIIAYPVSSFIISLYKQYISRGWLTKKQLQGLYGKAEKIRELSTGKLAALEAIINKMPTRYKSEAPVSSKPLYEKDETTGQLIDSILQKYPQHKRVLFLQSKYRNNEPLTNSELADLKNFKRLLK